MAEQETSKTPLETPPQQQEGVQAAAAAAAQIVFVEKPECEDPEAFHIRTLAAVLGSVEAAKDAVIYHYTHAASGFSAKLTPVQVEELSKQPGVLQIMPSGTCTLHGPSTLNRRGVRPTQM